MNLLVTGVSLLFVAVGLWLFGRLIQRAEVQAWSYAYPKDVDFMDRPADAWSRTRLDWVYYGRTLVVVFSGAVGGLGVALVLISIWNQI